VEQPPDLPAQPPLAQAVAPPQQRFQFNIAPNTPLKDLLPDPPKVRKPAGPVLTEDLAEVPEVELQALPSKKLAADAATRNVALSIAKVNHLNAKKTDGFLEALRGERPDLAGLPFAMGDACRTKGERSRQFALAVATVRRALQPQPQPALPAPASGPGGPPNPAPPAASVPVGVTATGAGSGDLLVGFVLAGPAAADRIPAETFWDQYQAAIAAEDKAASKNDRVQCEHVTLARIAALMQVLAPESPDMRLGLVKYLSGVAHPEASRALARLAIFSPEEEVRRAAVDALQVRRERDYTDVLLRGLHYPWPAVARRAAEAAVKLERADLVPQLVALLDEPDPRAPVLEEVDKKTVPVVHELVRVNHHRSCLMCHAPGNTDKVSPEALTAAVPVPGEPLPSPSQGYVTTSPDTVVRIDVTYLRQDFSVRQPVADANPWPEMQRFDFLVRRRVLTPEEADTYRAKFDRRETDRPSPYRRAVVAALRDLTGWDAEPTAEAWRRTLGLAAPQRP
jgi:hypothetical protein